MDKRLVALLVGGALVMGVTAWLVYPSRPAEPPKNERRYMHCPSCGREARYEPGRYEKDCPYCGQKGPLVATTESVHKTGLPAGSVARLLPPLLVELTLLVGLFYWYATARMKQVQEEWILYMDCKYCGKRLRYKECQVGKMGQCPLCKRPFIFPRVAPDEGEGSSHWWHPRWWLSGQWRKLFRKTT